MSAVRRGWRARRNDENRASAEAHATLQADKEAETAAYLASDEYAAKKAAHDRRQAQRGTYTAENIGTPTYVHASNTWRKVVRLNAKSVTVQHIVGTSTERYDLIDDVHTEKVPA